MRKPTTTGIGSTWDGNGVNGALKCSHAVVHPRSVRKHVISSGRHYLVARGYISMEMQYSARFDRRTYSRGSTVIRRSSTEYTAIYIISTLRHRGAVVAALVVGYAKYLRYRYPTIFACEWTYFGSRRIRTLTRGLEHVHMAPRPFAPAHAWMCFPGAIFN